jgi:hypothetical protein
VLRDAFFIGSSECARCTQPCCALLPPPKLARMRPQLRLLRAAPEVGRLSKQGRTVTRMSTSFAASGAVSVKRHCVSGSPFDSTA